MGKYVLKLTTTLKADIWKKFPMMIHETKDGFEKSVDYFCACSKCFQVYQYKDCNGKQIGTKNQTEHLKRYAGISVSNDT